ncbi:MAG: twin-arginine translocase TatA/TatE family subunit [Muribaculaceae bacterium]|nr:twin-arginine translocase TatA/TatE family subunit [Muribaculaceae bacterium]
MTLFSTLPLILGNIRGWQLIILILLLVLLFGGKRIPEMMRSLGKGVHSFKQGVEEAKREASRPVKLSDDMDSAEKTHKDKDSAAK